jgi:hypothetical protein
LALELKVPPNKPTKYQSEWLGKLAGAGWKVGVCYDLDDLIKMVDDYLETPPEFSSFNP